MFYKFTVYSQLLGHQHRLSGKHVLCFIGACKCGAVQYLKIFSSCDTYFKYYLLCMHFNNSVVRIQLFKYKNQTGIIIVLLLLFMSINQKHVEMYVIRDSV